MERAKIERINELYKKSKNEGLSEAEKEEQKLLREEYLREIRLSFGKMLENTVVERPDGSREHLVDLFNKEHKNSGQPPEKEK